MKKIDAHLHIAKVVAGYCRRGELRAIGNGYAKWANGEVMKLFPDGYGDINFTAESAIKIMNENRVDKAVLMQGSMYGFQNDYTHETMEKYPHRFQGACTIDPFMTNHMEILEYLMEKQSFRIVKFEMSSGGGLMGCHDKFSLDCERMMKIYKYITKKDGVLVLDIGDISMKSYQPEAVKNISTAFSDLKIVVCHLLAPTLGKEEILKKDLQMLNLKNIWFDLAALPIITSPDEYPHNKSLEFIKIGKEILGANKLLWGTDAPFAAVSESYSMLERYITDWDVFTKDELDCVFYKNAEKVYFNM